jgi:beta-glucosidase
MDDPKSFEFPEGFVWGTATASYQVEGAVDADGRKPSIWDTFCGKPGAIIDASSGKDACRHYERWEEDLDLMKWMGLGSYRFSVAWPRIIPGGVGALNPKGLDWYEKLVDGLLKRGIQPNATLYHWDLPQPLEDKNGWLNRDTAQAYADYAGIVVKRLGDRVDFWSTFNEPQVFTACGYQVGVHAPGRKETPKNFYQIIHHVLLAHGLGIQAIRANLKKPGAKAGIVLAPVPVWPHSSDPKDIEASERHWEDSNDWWVQPMMLGHYPEAVFKRRGGDAPQVQAGDMGIIRQPMDFLGLNYYFPARTKHPENGGLWEAAQAPQGAPRQAMERWEIFAPALERLIVEFSRRYPKIALYITENGMSQPTDVVDESGKIADPARIAFLRGHLRACLSAIRQGADLRGYYCWSFMDNFEWGYGYTQRFGLIHVDYETYKRSPKDSAYWYREAAMKNGFA